MRKLHLVGLTTDRDGLIFTARKGSKSGGFIVPLDDKVRAAIAQASGGVNGGEPGDDVAVDQVETVPKRLRSESALTPREMQARLRAGRSIEEVAAEAGVDTEWVARFAVPILAEQAQVVELARALVYAKPRLGESTQALGMSVLQNLSDRGVFLPDDVANSGWSAFQLHDSVWMVRFRYRSRGRDQEAQWEIDVPTGRLRARNRHASDLGYVGPERWRGGAEPGEEPQVDEDVPVAPTRRPARKAPSSPPEPMATPKAVPTAKRLAATRPPARAAVKKGVVAKKVAVVRKGAAVKKSAVVRKGAVAKKGAVATRVAAAQSSPAVKAGRSTKTANTRTAAKSAVGNGKAASARQTTKGARTATAAKSSPRTASAKSATRRRPAKAVPAPEVGPTAGSGSVRMAVAQVSTARVKASMATADREPWAAVVRRPSRPVDRGDASGSDGRRRAAPEPVRMAPRADPVAVRTFEPRPLPPPGTEPPPRVRKITVARPAPRQEPPAVSLPAPRAAQRSEPLPVERPKRRRLRSR